MPDLNTHIAAGLGVSYLGAKTLGLDTDFLIIGVIGALLSSAREEPFPNVVCDATNLFIDRAKKLFRAVCNMVGCGFFAAAVASILIHRYEDLVAVALPIAGLLGFFAHVAIKTISSSIPDVIKTIVRFFMNRVGLGDKGGKNADPLP